MKETRVTTYFCDGLKEVSVVNGVVRLAFHCLETVQRGQNCELRPVPEFTVALPLPGFAQALETLDNVRTQFAARGLVGPADCPDDGALPPAKPARSPNFS
jgi:hypothetical protein